MAHRILGLDIGHTAIKVAVIDKTMRKAVLTHFDEETVAIGATDEDRQDAVRRVLARNLRPDDVVSVGLPSALCLHRTLSFPFRDPKSLAEAIGFELENHIPTPVSEMVVDHIVLGEKKEQTEVLALAAPRARVIERLGQLRAVGVEPRRLGLEALAYASLIRELPQAAEGTTMLVDVGTASTQVVVFEGGRTKFVRSLSVGAQSVEELFSAHFETGGASDILQTHGFLLPHGIEPETPNELTLHEATADALSPLLRELRQTIASWQRAAHTRPSRLLVTGGLTRLVGLHEFLERSLGLPVDRVRVEDLADVQVTKPERLSDLGVLALAQALAGADSNTDHDVDFRQGELAYEGDYKVLRARMPQLVAFIVIAVCLLGIRTSLDYRGLVTEQDQQIVQLQSLSKKLSGKAMSTFTVLRTELGRTPKVDLTALYPDMSAFKVLEDISAIIDKVTEPPEYVPPGGPGDVRMPGVSLGTMPMEPTRLPDPAMLTQRRTGLPGVPAGLPPGGLPARPTRPRPDPMAGAGAMPGAAAAGDAGGGEDGEAPAEGPAPFTGHKIELQSVQIDRTSATLRGDADTQDALLALQEGIDAHRCFGKVKSSSDRITFERHRDWFKFTVQFEIACPAAKPVKDADAKKAADGKKVDDKAAEEKTADDKAAGGSAEPSEE
jgi:type IV pilus assembly protein PilM